ncbi:unnamed protein product, partial [Onchocerca ochengi]
PKAHASETTKDPSCLYGMYQDPPSMKEMGWGPDYKIISTNKLPSARSSGPVGDKLILLHYQTYLPSFTL